MTKLRDNTGVILWILVIAFGVIWTLQDSGAFDNAGMTTGNEIIIVNGEAVTSEEYSRAVNNQIQQIEQRTGQALTPQRRDMIRQQVYESLVNDKLREQEMTDLGVTVTDEEVYNMILGQNPHPFITARFSTEEGTIDRALVENLASTRPQAWLQIEEYMRSVRRQEKLNSLIDATVRVSAQDVVAEYQRQNTTATAQYVALPYASIPADSVNITEEDLREYYQEHREDYRREKTYSVNYVTISKEATSADTAEVVQSASELKEEFRTAESDSVFMASQGSVQQYTDAWYGRGDLQPALAEAVYDNLETGTVVGPLVAGDRVHLVKIQDVRQSEEPSIRARHILLSASGENAQVRQRAQNLIEQLRGGADFADLARQHSTDPGSRTRGGQLGWFTRGSMVASFEEAAFNADVGEIVGPVQTQFGYHIIKVTGRSDREVKIADFQLPVYPNTEALRQAQSQLADLSYFASESGGFTEEAQRMGLDPTSVQVEEGQESIPNIGFSRELQIFLEGSESGDISEVIELDDQYIVAAVESVNDAEYRPFEEVRSQIRPLVLNQRRQEILTRRFRQAMETNSFSELPQALNTQMRTAESIGMNTAIIPGLGRAPEFIGAAFGLEEGEVSSVIPGEAAVFVLKVTDKQTPPPITASQRQTIRNQLLQERRQHMRNEWITALREQAVIEDNRARFNY